MKKYLYSANFSEANWNFVFRSMAGIILMPVFMFLSKLLKKEVGISYDE